MTEATAAQALGLGKIDQLGFVVRDLEQAMALYEPLFGPFTRMDAEDLEWLYRGRPAVSTVKIAYARSGEVEVELIQWVSGDTPHKEFIDAGREGMHHLRFRVDDMDAKIAAAAKLGYRPIWQKRFAEGLAAVYLERDGDSVILELFENHFD